MKRKNSELVPNVQSVLSTSAARAGQWESEYFIRRVNGAIKRFGIDSPIEQMLLIALMVVGKENALEVATNPEHGFHYVCIQPQRQIGKYRVDFVLISDQEDTPPVAVECDGHEFHDRDERQRRYEKKRDRFLQQEGYLVMHFTGSEINQDPYAIAAEIIQAAIGDMLIINP